MNDFLSEVDVSQWMLYHMDVAAARFGRGLVVGKIYDCNGNLLVVCVSLFFFWMDVMFKFIREEFLFNTRSLNLISCWLVWGFYQTQEGVVRADVRSRPQEKL